MKRSTSRAIIVALALAGAASVVPAQQPASAQGAGATSSAPDVVLSNGKIITVDDRFSIAQAVAIRGDRIVAVGSDAEVGKLATPATRRIDLRGRAVIPGLIDNHMHLLRAGATWQSEVRLDGVASRKQLLDMLRARAKTAKPGAWIYTLGGWAVEQLDDKKPFTRAELDAVVPDHPVFLQASYYEAYLNSLALQQMKIDEKSPEWAERDAKGQLTGRIAEAGFRGLVNRIPAPSPDEAQASTAAMIKDLNRFGLTTFGSAGCEANVLPYYQRLAGESQLNVRVFCITGNEKQIPQMKLFQGNNYFDYVTYGESVYGQLHDPMFLRRSNPTPEQLAEWRRIATEVAKARLPLHVHANLEDTISAFLDQIEAINKEYPIKNLRWVLAHANQLNATHLARMRELGVYAAVHPWAVINGGINQRVFGEAALDMAPLDTIQRSGVIWGFGSDGNRANQILPFTTLGWAVTGKMVGGTKVLRQPISREDALIAHTRRNAFFVFQENNLGSIQAGRLADLVVLDRDYLTIPADQIKDIKPTMTMVGGRIVYEAAP